MRRGAEARSRKPEARRQETGDRRQKPEARSQKPGGRRWVKIRKSETLAFILLPPRLSLLPPRLSVSLHLPPYRNSEIPKFRNSETHSSSFASLSGFAVPSTPTEVSAPSFGLRKSFFCFFVNFSRLLAAKNPPSSFQLSAFPISALPFSPSPFQFAESLKTFLPV
jgi:hypothetical protein